MTEGNSKGNYLGTFWQYIQGLAETEIKLSLEDYDDKAKVWHDIFFRCLPKKDDVPLVDGTRKVLDIGCNTGYNTKELEELYGYAEGIDIIRRLLDASVLNHDKCKAMRCEDLKYEDETFSLVVAKDVYEHTRAPNASISEAYRVLVDKGFILVMIPLDGEVDGVDDVIIHPSFTVGNETHLWKATYNGVLARLFGAGFTEVEVFVYTHSELFGEPRPFGDRVLVVRAQKIKNIKKVPLLWLLGNNYWAAFLTFRCSGNCVYCIQHLCKDEFLKARAEYSKAELDAQDWSDFYNSLQRFKNHKLSIIGGEPTAHNDFFGVVNNIKGYYKTITTNLKTPLFDDIGSFSSNIEDKNFLRINTSFHPEIITVDDFCNKVHRLREEGFYVDQIAMVDYPTSNFKYYYNEFVKRGLVVNPQTYLGKLGDILLPNPEFGGAEDYHEHGITDFGLYNQGFSCKEKSEILCMTRRFMVAPDGGIYRCHYHLYSKRNAIGNIKEAELSVIADYTECADFGYCNPCDFPHAKFKLLTVDMPNILRKMLGNKDVVANVLGFLQENSGRVRKVLEEAVVPLYKSDDPYWELYNNVAVREAINSFILEGIEIDNSNALLIAQLDGAVFRFLKRGVNVYRLLEPEALYKYVDAVGYLIFVALARQGGIFYHVRIPELANSLESLVASLQVSIGTMHLYEDTFAVWSNPSEEDQHESIISEGIGDA